MKIKGITLIIISVILMTVAIANVRAENTGLKLNTIKKQVKVFLQTKELNLELPILAANERTFYPFREILESAGATVNWDNKNKVAEAELGETKILFPLYQNYYYVNGEKKNMDVPTSTHGERTYIPIRYAFEALGYEVDWISCKTYNQIRLTKYEPYALPSDEEYLAKYYNSDRTTPYYYKLDSENEQVIFTDTFTTHSPYSDKVLENPFVPDFNKKIYELLKVLPTEGDYIFANYYDDDEGRVLIKFGRDTGAVWNQRSFFEFIFSVKMLFSNKANYNNNYSYLSEKCFLSLNFGNLFWNPEVDGLSTLLYETRLRNSFIALFGQETGIKVFKYILADYYINANLKAYERSQTPVIKKIDNLQIESARGLDRFYTFSFLE